MSVKTEKDVEPETLWNIFGGFILLVLLHFLALKVGCVSCIIMLRLESESI